MKRPYLIRKKILIIFVPVLFFAISACVDSNYDLNSISDEVEISPGFDAPIVTGSLSLDNILKEISSENVGKFPDDSLIFITFSDNLFSNTAADVLNIPDQSFPAFYIASDITIPAWIQAALNQPIKFSKQLNQSFTVSHNERIDSIKIKTATLKIQMSSTFKLTGALRLTTDNVKINGHSFIQDITIGNSSGTFSSTINISLDNAAIYLNSNNAISLKYELELIKSNEDIVAGQECKINMSFENIKFQSVYGYLGDYNILVDNGQFDLGIYNDLLGGGELLFADPRFSLFLKNSYGIPVEITLSNVSAYSKKNNITTPIIFNGINPFNIIAPDKNHIGKFVQDTITINKNNCNIVQAMETSPKTFSYNISARTNPAGPGSSYNFVTDTSTMNVNFEIVLPIWIRAQGFSLRDTMDLDINKDFGDVFDFINYFRFTLEGKNEFPLKVGMQAYFTDANYVVLDSLFVGNSVLLKAPAVDLNGKVSIAADFKQTVDLSKERLTGIKNTKFAIFKADLSTSNATAGQYVKFFSYYKLDFKMSVKTNLRINSKEL
jgi:hypothetical protein